MVYKYFISLKLFINDKYQMICCPNSSKGFNFQISEVNGFSIFWIVIRGSTRIQISPAIFNDKKLKSKFFGECLIFIDVNNQSTRFSYLVMARSNVIKEDLSNKSIWEETEVDSSSISWLLKQHICSSCMKRCFLALLSCNSCFPLFLSDLLARNIRRSSAVRLSSTKLFVCSTLF